MQEALTGTDQQTWTNRSNMFAGPDRFRGSGPIGPERGVNDGEPGAHCTPGWNQSKQNGCRSRSGAGRRRVPFGSVRRCAHSAALAPARHARSHAPTLIGTPAARLRAFTAVLHRMPLAFFSARIADLRAELALCTGELAPSRHQRDARSAHLGAIDVERDASRELLDVLLGQTFGSTVAARCCALVACIDAALH
jgi:hypothetical protein